MNSAAETLESGARSNRFGAASTPVWKSVLVDLPLHLLGALFCAALVAGFIDSIAGGGGLITVPAMLIAGVPPLHTLGTNKLQSLFGSGSATLAYARAGHVDLRRQLPMAAACGFGAVVGAAVTTFLPGAVLKAVLPVMLIVIAGYFATRGGLGDCDRHARMSGFAFGAGFVPLVGFYDGIFGPGTGSFLMLGFVMLVGFGLIRATAHTKLLNFASNIGAFGYFALSGVVLWKAGLIMGAGQFAGAQIGSRLAMAKGARVIRPLLVLTSLAMALKLLADPANPLRVWLGW